ncbi:unnamed protein product [Plutella xylostella]|uniref:(diamondback moth) hypothetical protein n=1 Tax=Plutella xylostella TaxID=51655 RepID=A0A8S4G583_PLUXY|nr:unnamed protein product [Plutella xylostella]
MLPGAMGSRLVPGLVVLLVMGGYGQEHGPVWLLEPPARLVFSNSTGARVSCAAHGSPPPALAWQLPDGAPLHDVPGLRQVLDNGTLVFPAFPAARYRQDVHGAVYRCRASSAHGAVLSRDMRVLAGECHHHTHSTRRSVPLPRLLRARRSALAGHAGAGR